MRSAVRSRLAPPRSALRATRGAAARCPKGGGVPGEARRAKTGVIADVVVYIIRSIDFPDQEYVGATENLKQRIPDHNSGKSSHTAKFKPWKLVWYCAFPDKYKALEFEKYLKLHSGRAFAKKRLLLGARAPLTGVPALP
ncbi:MAG: GIY-YIG nuclease family protein [Bradyrhizobium sp.]|nr:GIY-YIG nuclease family protein [Bradyrhizobium sp.]